MREYLFFFQVPMSKNGINLILHIICNNFVIPLHLSFNIYLHPHRIKQYSSRIYLEEVNIAEQIMRTVIVPQYHTSI